MAFSEKFRAFFERRKEKKRLRREEILSRPDSRSIRPDIKRRGVAMLCILLLLFPLLVVRIGYIHAVHGEEYEQKAIEQQLSDKPVYARRGNIYDRNGKLLATSVTAYTVFLSSAYIKNEDQRVVIAKGLSEILDYDYDKLYEMTGKDLQYQLVQRRISNDQATAIRELINKNGLNSIGLSEDYKRLYPYGGLLSQVLGFTGVDAQGLSGLEKQYETYLTGVNGRAVTAQNAVGTDMEFSYETYIDAQDGYNLILTVDEVIQSFLEKYLQQMYEQFELAGNAMGVVMDVKNGEILGMGQYPTFDSNDPFAVEDRNLWINSCVSAPYEPGSTFKSLVTAMALEEDVATPDTHFSCSGSVHISGQTLHCFRRAGHGDETLTVGLVNSCNPVFIEVASRLHADRFFRYFSAFGLTERSGIDLPNEAIGLYHKEEDLNQLSLATSGFGQTFTITPIQMLTAFCAAVNGGKLVTPHIVKEVTDEDGNVIKSAETTIRRQVVSKSTSETLCQMLEAVVENGGSATNAYVTGYRVAGKTGTSDKTQTRNESGQTDGVWASMIAAAPADDPQVAILIIADDPRVPSHSGGTVAGPAIGNVLSEILPYLGIDPVFTDEELEEMELTTPSLLGTTVEKAINRLEYMGLNADVRGSGDKIISQMPASGTQIPSGGKVILYTEGAEAARTVLVPTLIGLSPAQAAKALTNAGLNVRYKGFSDLEGTLRVYEQSVDPDTPVEEGTVVTISVRVETATE